MGMKTPYIWYRLLRSVMISYTPPFTTSFFNRSSGPPSGRSQAAPVDDMLGSVAAKMMAPPTRSIGTSGIPAIITLFSVVNMAVSVPLSEPIQCIEKKCQSRTCEEWVDDGHPYLLLCQRVGQRSSQSQNPRLRRSVYWTLRYDLPRGYCYISVHVLLTETT